MSLPILVLSRDEKWTCHQCGVCCKGSIVPLSDLDLKKIRGQQWELEPGFEKSRTLVRIGWTKRFRLAHRSDGSCVFLDRQGGCRIHTKFGAEAKPVVCRVFPLQLIPRDQRSVLTLRRACPSAALDRGQDLKSHLSTVNELVRQGDLRSSWHAPPLFKHGEPRNWPTMMNVLEWTGRLFCDERYPPVRRVVHAMQFASLLSAAKTTELSDGKLIDLVRTLVELAPEESRVYFQEKKEPSWQGQAMFRQMGAEYARLHPLIPQRRNLRDRLRLMTSGWRIYRGKPLIAMNPPFAAVSLNALDQPLGKIDASIDRLLSRHLEVLATSYLYAIADRQRWSVIESIFSLSSLFPVGMWLLRWVSYGRKPTNDDIVSIIVALDRGQGFQSLNGKLHAWRLKTLAASHDLQRLAVKYAQ